MNEKLYPFQYITLDSEKYSKYILYTEEVIYIFHANFRIMAHFLQNCNSLCVSCKVGVTSNRYKRKLKIFNYYTLIPNLVKILSVILEI